MRFTISAALYAALAAAPIAAQSDSSKQPVVTAPSAPAPLVLQKKIETATSALPANTEVLLSLNNELTTKGKSLNEGDSFNLTVVHDVLLGDYVVIPKGARAVGEVTWLTSKGAFGKSGKMEIEIRYVEVNGQRIELEGEFRQEGEGNTVATVGGVVLAGVFAGFITGKSGRIPAGRELMARTKSDVPVAFAGPAPATKPEAILALPSSQVVSESNSESDESTQPLSSEVADKQ
jgi:hypothetical protein